MVRNHPKSTLGTTAHAVRVARQLTRPQREFLLRLVRAHVSTAREGSVADGTVAALQRRHLVVSVGTYRGEHSFRLTTLGAHVAAHCTIIGE